MVVGHGGAVPTWISPRLPWVFSRVYGQCGFLTLFSEPPDGMRKLFSKSYLYDFQPCINHMIPNDSPCLELHTGMNGASIKKLMTGSCAVGPWSWCLAHCRGSGCEQIQYRTLCIPHGNQPWLDHPPITDGFPFRCPFVGGLLITHCQIWLYTGYIVGTIIRTVEILTIGTAVDCYGDRWGTDLRCYWICPKHGVE